jgi:hypothetical protein
MLDFKKEATKKLLEIGVYDIQYSRVDGNPLFKIDVNKIDTLKKYFIVELVSILEGNITQTLCTPNNTYMSYDSLLKATDFTNNYKRKIKLKHIQKCQRFLS